MGKRGTYSPEKRRFRVPIAAWVLLLIAGASAITGTVTAWLSAATDPVKNDLISATSPEISVSETFQDNTKSNVSVDVGDPGYAVFVRAAVVITWKSESGEVLGKLPLKDTDYTIEYAESGWFQKGEFWYCESPVTSGKTPVLIKTCSPVPDKTPAGYGLNVEIIAQTIQARGTTDTGNVPAVTDAWKVSVSGGKLIP